jgi:general secretion pathway protein G
MRIRIWIAIFCGVLCLGQDKPDSEAQQDQIKQDIRLAIEMLGAENPVEGEEGRKELLELGHRAVPQLIEALEHESPQIRLVVCDILGEIRNPSAVDPLIKMLQDKDEYGVSIASVAARALGLIGEPKAIKPLLDLLDSDRIKLDVELRYEVIRALGILRATEAVDKIRKFVDDKATLYITKKMVAMAAMEALARLRAEDAIDEIAALLGDKTKEEWSARTLEMCAAKALERITGTRFGAILEEESEVTKETLKKWGQWWEKRKKLKEDQKKAQETRALLAELQEKLEGFKKKHGRYPGKLEELINRPEYIKKEDWPEGGYLKELPKDGWGKLLNYRCPSQFGTPPYDLYSLGADSTQGGEGVNQDIWNHELWKKKQHPE